MNTLDTLFEQEAEQSADWLAGWTAAGGMLGWLKSGERQRMQNIIDAQQRVIESLTEQLAGKDRMAS